MESATTHGQQVINIKGQGRSDKEICGHKMQFQFFFVNSKPSNSVQLLCDTNPYKRWAVYLVRLRPLSAHFKL